MKDTITTHYHRARALAVKRVIELARDAMRRDPRLREFVMAMGTWSFSDKDGNAIYDDSRDRPRSTRRLEDFIDTWDEVLKITGEPIRFKADGPIVRDW